MRIFGHHLNRLGREISTYFTFTRPCGITLTFHEILKRANTLFVLTLQRPQDVDKYPAEVREYITLIGRSVMLLHVLTNVCRMCPRIRVKKIELLIFENQDGDGNFHFK